MTREHDSGAEAPLGPPRRRFQIVAGLSAVLLLVGLGLMATESGETTDTAGQGGPGGAAVAPAGGSSLVDTGPGSLPFPPTPGAGDPDAPQGDPSATAGASQSWSPLFVKGGLSLFLGFTIGYAFRFFFKVSLAAVGVFSLLVLAMAYVGFLEIHWEVLSEAFDRFAVRVQAESQAFHSFLTGSVPSTALAVTGLVTGVRRR